MCMLSHVQLFVTPWTVARQARLSMGFSRQEYWSGLPFPPPGHLPDPGIEPVSPTSAGGFFTTVLFGKQVLGGKKTKEKVRRGHRPSCRGSSEVQTQLLRVSQGLRLLPHRCPCPLPWLPAIVPLSGTCGLSTCELTEGFPTP